MSAPVVQLRVPEGTLARLDGTRGEETRSAWILRPWRESKRPRGQSMLSTAAACLKGFYVFQGSRGAGQEVAEAFKASRLPSRADRQRHGEP